MSRMLNWYGYRHLNGTLHVKRYLGDYGSGELADTKASPFVREVFGPFEAQNQHLAECKLKRMAEDLGRAP